jgi:tetratricopeptide (TPR) repeat protein
MKKLILPLLIIILVGLLLYKYGCEGLFTLGAVKKVRPKGVTEIKKETDESVKRYRAQLEGAEKVGSNYEKLGREYVKKGDWTPAIEALTQAIEYGNTGARVHYFLGAAYANRANETAGKDDIEKAEHHYKMAVEKNPKIYDASYGLGILTFYLKKDRDKGIEIMKEISFKEPSYYQARFALGRFYYESGEAARALSVYQDHYSDLQKKPDSRL